ncbi:MAG TPA: hypothetical protein PLB52_01005 [Candidatus Moranbacteria bacterium]|nr:hypothetical protein [Candidatus Moranbacteria bacterium]
MYWLYLVIFTLIVFVPTAIHHGFYIFDKAQTQEFTILILGSLGFMAFLFQEKKLKKNIAEKTDIQRKVNTISKDLTHSYSYIGEVNRKLDILEKITLSYPESLHVTTKEQKEIYNSAMQAIGVIAKSDNFVLRFTNFRTKEVLKEIKSIPSEAFSFSYKKIERSAQFMESDDFFVITSPKYIDDIEACIIIKKKTPGQKIEDLEMLRILASQALFIFMFINGRKKSLLDA